MVKYPKFVDVPVRDQDRALDFYTDKLGLHVARDMPYGDGWRWIELSIPGAETNLLLTPKGEEEDSEAPVLVLAVDNVEESYRELSDKGVEFSQRPAAADWSPGETYALLRDSENNTVMLGSG